MAILLKGKNKGKEVIIHQWSNDWFSIEVEGKSKIVSPLALQLNLEEMNRVLDKYTLFSYFILHSNGTFSKQPGNLK